MLGFQGNPHFNPIHIVSKHPEVTASRREVLRGGIAAVAGLGFGCRRGRSSEPAETTASPIPRGDPDVEVSLRATPAEVLLDPSSKRATRVWRYEGRLLRGRSDTLTFFDSSYLGPTFHVRTGQRVRVQFENGLAEDSIVHWHGLDMSQENDGHPRFAVPAGGRRAYDFEVTGRPATYWYHPHPDRRTGPQVYAGLAGLFIVSDGEDAARGLPSAPFDLPLVIQDRVIGVDGQLVYQPNPMLGLLGNLVFVNGRPAPRFEVKEGSYRLRLLNGSNARIYKLAWSDDSPIIVLASDGGLLGTPLTMPYVMLAPGERIEIWADFGRRPGGAEVSLESLSFDGGGTGAMGRGGGMMGGGMMMGGGGPGARNGAPLTVCRFLVRGPGERRPLPARFETPGFRPSEEVANAETPRRFQVSMAMMRWMLNGSSFDMSEVAPNERIKRGVTEDWEFSNLGSMMAVAHPIHIHGGQFQIVARTLVAGSRAPASTVNDGLVDRGWKDTFLLMPGERVRVRVRFPRHEGLFLYHCHNLEHEDMGMMRNFRVEG
jgi:FtsP/CotA-like multicopper oxidase with cupredoxin domain